MSKTITVPIIEFCWHRGEQKKYNMDFMPANIVSISETYSTIVKTPAVYKEIVVRFFFFFKKKVKVKIQEQTTEIYYTGCRIHTINNNSYDTPLLVDAVRKLINE